MWSRTSCLSLDAPGTAGGVSPPSRSKRPRSVLEIGVEFRMNLALYPPSAAGVIGLDPSPKLLSMARRSANQTPVTVELLEATAEALPVKDKSVDTVVTTWTLCSILDGACARRSPARASTGWS